jgi:ATP-dependent Clp protease ATP-binding subunit ClpB
LSDRQIQLVLSEQATELLAELGFDPVYGTRPLKRAIQKEIETPLAKEILAGTIMDGQQILADAEEGAIVFRQQN